MDIQQLLEKMKTEGLTEDEQQQLFNSMQGELQALKEKDPKKYLEVLTQLTQAIDELNKDLEDIASA